MFYKNLKDVSKKRLSREQQSIHIVKAQNGEQDSIDILISSNYKLVIKIANKFKNNNLELEDLVQEGILGLFEAIIRFDLTKQNKFTTYANYWIVNKIGDYCRKNGSVVRYPTYLITDHKKINKYQKDFVNKFSRPPNDQTICKDLNFSPQKLQRIYSIGQAESLDA